MTWPRGVSTLKVNGKRIYAPFYFRWRGMKNRCLNSRNSMYYLYGGRGISVCEEWMDFWKFYDWCVSTHIRGCSIDRVNPNGNYEPKNCRWATPVQQQENSRETPRKMRALDKAHDVLRENPALRTRGHKRDTITGRFAKSATK